ncbi:MAG TPA: glutamate synthase central domain-containing protein, partial [Ktedonobacteraceae bacterium]|nr:glutamate synthase central domain-containing protein [Ktedonobacteraceae bacterium]
LTQIPAALFCAELEARNVIPPDPDDLAVGMIFLPSPPGMPAYEQSRHIIEQTCIESGLILLGWREPPIDYSVPGARARATAPCIMQILLARPLHLTIKQYERTLYHTRRLIEQRLRDAHIDDCHIVSFSHSTIIYKGLLAPDELARFYLDLADPRYSSAFAIFHQRYSTNTLPSWPLAQPMRLLAHNGEINTLLGNRNWMQAREGTLFSPLWGGKLRDLLPVIQEDSSDSGQLDNVLELLTLSGRDLLHSMQMLIPPAWEQNAALDAEQRAWCEYHAGLTEPWDGPAALIFSDGAVVGAALDRNGLRPARYTLTSHGLLILASEAGVVPCEAHEVVEKGRLGPGEMIAVDLKYGVVLRNSEIKSALARRHPYKHWLTTHLERLQELPSSPVDTHVDAETLFQRQQLYGFTHEDIELILRPMLAEHKEPVWSMGDDTPSAAFSRQSRAFSDYFRQRFAQVTNPPIDPLREQIVMSLDCYLGRRQSLLTETPLHARLLHLETPILTETQLETVRNLKQSGFLSRTLHAAFDSAAGSTALEQALDSLDAQAIEAATDGISLLILSDREASETAPPIPMLLAVASVHRALIRGGLRTHTSLICETGSAWDVHQIALLSGYGAEAIAPFMAFASVRALAGERKLEHLTHEEAVEVYIRIIEHGLRKVMARMGISTLRNIIGAGQFEVVGLAPELVERCFADSPTHFGNLTLPMIAEQLIERVSHLSKPIETYRVEGEIAGRRRKLADIGRIRFRRDAEYHAYNPLIIRALQKAARSGKEEDYEQFTRLVYQRPT